MYRVNSLIGKRLFSVGNVPEFKKVGVVGLGLMGHGVAQVVAQAGFQVVAIESNANAMNAGLKRLSNYLNFFITLLFSSAWIRIDGSLGKVIAKDVQKGTLTEVRYGNINSSAILKSCALIRYKERKNIMRS